MDIAYGRALYYPYIHFQDKWIKTAALYYQGIDRIVPQDDAIPKDSVLVQQLIDDDGFIRDIDPSEKADDVARDFLDFAREKMVDPEIRANHVQAIGAVVSPDVGFSIHMYKMGEILQKELPQLGLAFKNPLPKNEHWFEFEPVTGAIYMSFLANAIAEGRQLPIVTDDAAFQPLIRSIQSERYHGSRDIGHALASIVIQSVVPDDIANIPLKKILEFRRKYDDERHLFYNEVNKLTKDIESVESQEALQDCLEARKRDIEIAVKNLQMSFKGIGIGTTVALLGLSVPSFLSGLGPAVAIAGVIAVAGGKVAEKGLEYYKSRRGSPYSYVLSLQNKLKAETFAQQLFKGKILM